MINQDIDRALGALDVRKNFSKEAKADTTIWRFAIGTTPAFIQTQSRMNRMRIVAQIGHPSNDERSDLTSLMEANYHSAIDCRYAIADGRLVAMFLHPLTELTQDQFISGLGQVISCVLTCGKENTGGALEYGKASGKAYEGQKNPTLAELLSSLGSGSLSGSNLNVNVYQGNVGKTKIEQNLSAPSPGAAPTPSRFDLLRYVVVPLLVAVIGMLGLVVVAIVKGWLS
jgi:hypothetical protein